METNSQRDIAGLPTHVENVITELDLSVCIVTYKARDMLESCLQSLYENSSKLNLEVIVSDNGSDDGTVEMLQREFPAVHILENDQNLGFAKPMNQALRASQGNYALLLNPDTMVLPNAFDRLIDFMESHPGVGICGPKVLNSDYTLQKPCRRGESRPWAVISYFTGLARLFPKSKFFGEYLMSYMDENETHAVAGVAGSCMLIRRELFEQLGYLDELFFAYQEDADYCHRARQAGWKVYYLPEAQIIHYGGQGGSRVDPYRSIIEWHKSYWLYYHKNLASDYFFLFNWVYYLAMVVKLISALLINFFRREKFAGPRRKT
jgi:GT2 family glycosyltransferase